jgi:hypothetical protein
MALFPPGMFVSETITLLSPAGVAFPGNPPERFTSMVFPLFSPDMLALSAFAEFRDGILYSPPDIGILPMIPRLGDLTVQLPFPIVRLYPARSSRLAEMRVNAIAGA